MPFYRYLCSTCQTEFKKLRNHTEKGDLISCSVCNSPLMLMMGSPSALAKETTDDYYGKSVDMEIKTKIKERADKHFKEHELPRIIGEKGLEYAKEHGLVDQDGKSKK